MTDDLAGRLGEEGLIVHDEGPEPDVDEVYEGDGFTSVPLPAIEKNPPAQLIFAFETSDGTVKTVTLGGEILSLSFGKGWLCSINAAVKDVMPVVEHAAMSGLSEVHVFLENAAYVMHGNLDCSATFGYGSVTFTVAADEARYV